MQGFNMGRYYPPDASNPPQFNASSHPLGGRARKLNQGILTVRFELPFAVWCTHCSPPAIVGQGVRFNAEKKKVGNYHSTPVWAFRMKHAECGGWWEIRTDPKQSEYVVVEGARRRAYGEDDSGKGDGSGVVGEGELRMLTEEERERRREDAFANLEGRMEDKVLEKGNKKRVEELYEKNEVWRDPWEVNARLRRDFRAKRKLLKREERYKEGLQDRFGLGIEIVDAVESDALRAGLVEFGAVQLDQRVEDASKKPLFVSGETKAVVQGVPKEKKLKSEIRAEQSRQSLQQTLVGNTRAAVDPFLSHDAKTATSKLNLGIVKRKRDTDSLSDSSARITGEPPPPHKGPLEASTKNSVTSTPLVDYDSD